MVHDDRRGPELRNAPVQARSRERLRRVLDAADALLAESGAEAFTTTRIAAEAGMPVGSVYRFFADKEAIVDALAIRYWSDFDDLVAAAADLDEVTTLEDPGRVVLEALAAGFRARPGFLALWYGGLRTERVRDVTRPARAALADSVERILRVHWPQADPDLRCAVARMVVLTGDGLLREAFRRDRRGDEALLDESARLIGAYLHDRLGTPGGPA